MKSIRYPLIDFIRGFALINMVIYHLIWDLVYIFGVNMNWYVSKPGHLWQQTICITFIFLSGFCWNFGKRKIKRGLEILAVSFLITIFTAVFMPENTILFGVLTLLGSAALLMVPLNKVLKNFNIYVGFFISLIVFVLTKNISSGVISLGGFQVNIPENLYLNLFTAYLGFPPRGFMSVDYFPIIPWTFLYIAGYFFYLIIKKLNWVKPLQINLFPPIQWWGRKSLIIYVIHQPVIYIILKLIFIFK